MSLSTIDFLTPFDPTGYASISGAQLEQLVGGLYPNAGIGLIVASTDIAGVPTVPNATTTTKWQNYIWLRFSATATVPYVWNPSAASDPVLLQWQTVAQASIGVGTITGAMIASNTITDSNIANVNWSKILGAPTGFAPSGAAGGDLTGTYPNPSIAALAVTGAKIALATIVGGAGGNFVAKTIDIVNDLKPSGTGLAIPRTNAGATALEWFTSPIAVSANLGVTGNGLKIPQVNTGGTDYQLVSPNTSAFGRLLQKYVSTSNTAANTATNLAITGTAPTTGNTALATIFGVAGTMSFTPISAASTLIIRVTIQLSNTTNSFPFIVLFNGTTALASAIADTVTININSLSLTYSLASPGTAAQSFALYYAAPAGTTYINSYGGTATGVAALLTSSVSIEEWI